MSDEFNVTPTRPYMLRAFFEWLEDNSLTPYLLVDATQDGIIIPTEYVQDGKITLSIASRSTANMNITNDFVNFNARFNGASREVWVPMQAVMVIFAKENPTFAMPFDPNEYDNYVSDNTVKGSQTPSDSAKTTTNAHNKRKNKAGLKVLK